MNRLKCTLAALAWTWLAVAAGGCGQNKFEQEVEREKSAVQLAREVQQGGYGLTTTDELKQLIDDKTDFVLIDAMPEDDYRREHVPRKQFLLPKEPMEPWDPAQTDGRTAEQFAELLGANKNQLVVVYCGFVACGRSHNGAVWAKKLGYQNVRRYPGGIFAWKGAGNKTIPGGQEGARPND